MVRGLALRLLMKFVLLSTLTLGMVSVCSSQPISNADGVPICTNDSGATFMVGPNMQVNRMAHYFVSLPNGKVALIGGHGTGFVALNTTEIFDPETNSFVNLLQMNSPRDGSAVVKLKDGRYLIAGGAYDSGVAPGYDTAEIFKPADYSFTPVGKLNYARTNVYGATLENGKALLVGGWYSNYAGQYGEIFDPETNSFSVTGSLNTPRALPVVLPASNNRAVIIGGIPIYGGQGIEQVEVYDYETNSFQILSNTLFTGETGWKVYSPLRPIDEHRLWNGNYLLIASKENQFTLFTFDPQSLTFNKLDIPLPTYSTAILTIAGIDNQNKKVYLLGLSPTQPKPSALKLFTVDLISNSINDPQEFCTVTPSDYYVSSYASGLLPDGRIFITGGTTSTDYSYNFNPVKYTLLINPSYIQKFDLIVMKSGPGIGLVTSSVAGIICGTDCSQAYPSGITLTLYATPIEGSIFTGWSGDCAPNGQIQMDGNKTCVANFSFPEDMLKSFQLQLKKGWNLIGLSLTINVETYLNDQTIESLWKWIGNNWAVRIPVLEDKGFQYTYSQKFGFFTYVKAGHGFWVNAAEDKNVNLYGKEETGSLTVQEGWNLLGLKKKESLGLSTLLGNNYYKVLSIWKWDTSKNNWAVNLPLYQDKLTDYANSKGFSILNTIQPGEGFWIKAIEGFVID